MSRVELLLSEMDGAHARVERRLAGLTDAEYLWEPVEGCWTVRVEDGRAVVDYAAPDPVPAPVTTIAWRLVHVADCHLVYRDWAFADGTLTFPDLVPPLTADAAIDRLREGYRALRADLDRMSDGDLYRPVPTNWGERWPAWRIFTTMIHHETHHGAEIGVLRDLYLHLTLAPRPSPRSW